MSSEGAAGAQSVIINSDKEEMLVRIGLSEDVLASLLARKRVMLCLQLGRKAEEKGRYNNRRSFAKAVRRGPI